MDNQKAWDIVIAEIEFACCFSPNCTECPLSTPCSNCDERPFHILKEMKNKMYGQTASDIDPLVMSMCKVFSCVSGRECLL